MLGHQGSGDRKDLTVFRRFPRCGRPSHRPSTWQCTCVRVTFNFQNICLTLNSLTWKNLAVLLGSSEAAFASTAMDWLQKSQRILGCFPCLLLDVTFLLPSGSSTERVRELLQVHEEGSRNRNASASCGFHT